jgi:hypothetical protein
MENNEPWKEPYKCNECGSSDTYVNEAEYEIVCRQCGHTYRTDGPISLNKGDDEYDEVHPRLDAFVDQRIDTYATLGKGDSIEDYAHNLIKENVFSIIDYPAVIAYVRARLEAQPALYRGLKRVTITIPTSIYADIKIEAHREKRSEEGLVERAVTLYFALPMGERVADMRSSKHTLKDEK